MKLECEVQGIADVGRSRSSAQSIRRGRVTYGGNRYWCASMRIRAGRTPPPSPHFPIFSQARCARQVDQWRPCGAAWRATPTRQTCSPSCGAARSLALGAAELQCRGLRSKEAVGGGSGWPWAAAFLPAWRRRAFAAAVRLAIGMPAAPCRPRIAQPRSLDSMLMKCILARASARFATDLAVLYGLLCSCACVPFGRCR